MKTQKQRLLEYLQAHKTINPIQSWTELGIYRLGARIFDLKSDGFGIVTRRVEVVNRFGEKCKVAEYFLPNALCNNNSDNCG